MNSNVEDSTSDTDLSRTFDQRFLHLLNNGIDCDCEFVVGSKKIIVRGHKFLFSAASEVFHAMFYGELKEEETIRIEDLDPEGFQGLTQFVYAGEVKFTTAIHALLIYIAARKYIIPALSEKCISYLRKDKSIQSSEVLEFYEICKANNIPEFEDQCYEIIQQETDKVFESKYFSSIKSETMELILKSPSLRLESEYDVLLYFEKWVEVKAECQGIDVQKIISGSIFSDLKKLIRILTISSNDYFSKVACSSSLLTPEEKIAVACNLKMSNSKLPMPESLSFERIPRNFITSSISESGTYNHSYIFAIDLISINSSSADSSSRYEMTLVEHYLTSTVTYSKIMEYICFKVEISTNCDSLFSTTDLLTIKYKLELIVNGSIIDTLSHNELNIIIDWEIVQFNMVLAKIPISKLRNFLLGNTNMLNIRGLFSIILESPQHDPHVF